MDCNNTSGFPLAASSPSFNSNISFAMYSISDTTCVAIITILLKLISDIWLRILIRSFGSRPAVGSSRISILGSFKIAWAIKILCLIPPEKLPSFFLASSLRLTSSRTSSIRCEAYFLSIPFKAAIYPRNLYPVKLSYKPCCWGIYPNISRYLCPIDMMSSSFNVIEPLSAFKLSAIIFIRVDLPAPLGPKRP